MEKFDRPGAILKWSQNGHWRETALPPLFEPGQNSGLRKMAIFKKLLEKSPEEWTS